LRLPRGDEATIRRDKIEAYVLNPDHPVGKHKARLFALLLGLSRADADLLIEALREAAATQEAVLGREDEHGQRYTLDFPFAGPDGNAVTIRSAWIVREGAPPDLVTCFIL
jgi:hypothetical protein